MEGEERRTAPRDLVWLVASVAAVAVVLFITMVWMSGEGIRRADERMRTLVGTAAPAFELMDTDGNPVKWKPQTEDGTGAHGGILLFFWTVQSAQARELAGEVERLYEQFEGRGISVVGVDVRDSREIVEETAHSLGLTFTQALADEQITETFSVLALPALVLIGPDGVIMHASVGLGPNDQSNLAACLHSIAGTK